MSKMEMTDLSSLLFWYPKIKNLEIPQPKTEIVLLTKEELDIVYNERIASSLTEKVGDIISQKFKLPVFIRTDLSSAKHYWKDSCFYDGTNELRKHLWEIIEFNLCADVMGLPFKALVIREFIPMDSRFTAFHGDMPVNPERRYFIDKGKVLCHHPYWIEKAIEDSEQPSLENWKEILAEINTEKEDEIKLLTEYSKMVAGVLSGFFSIDFSKAGDGKWVLIDCGMGERSWHPKDCKHYGTVKIDYLQDFVKKIKKNERRIR